MRDKCFVAALLGCGWPPHKNYKWQDVQTLMTYGDAHYEYQTIRIRDYETDTPVHVDGGRTGYVIVQPCNTELRILMADGEKIDVKSVLPGQIEAPVAEGTNIGNITLYLTGFSVGEGCFTVVESVEKEKNWPELKSIFHKKKE